MVTVKSYTDIEQSKKLAEILPLESADMWYEDTGLLIPRLGHMPKEHTNTELPCWSLAALLGALLSATLDSSDNHRYRVYCNERFTDWHDNPIDACVAMLLKLHKQELL